MLDIVAWQDYLNCFTAIEREENSQHLLFLRANIRDVEHRLYSLYGDFDQILLSGRDRYNHAPRWPYDLVNLDYYGGLLYSNLARPRALQKLFSNQDDFRRSFLLLLTHDVRDADTGGEKDSFLDDLERMLIRDLGERLTIRRAMAWYRAKGTPDVARQVLYTHFLLRDSGETAHFRVLCRPGVTYIGTGGAKMLHFVGEFHHHPHAHRAVSEQSALELLNLGYCDLRDGELQRRIVPLIE